MGRPRTQRQREAKRREHRRYYAQTAFLYHSRPWTEKEDRLVLAHEIPPFDEGYLEPPLAIEEGGRY